MTDIHAIIAAIETLEPEQRRKLRRRLHATGVFAIEDLLTDQNKLRNATAVQVAASTRVAAQPPVETRAVAPPPAPHVERARQAPTPHVLPADTPAATPTPEPKRRDVTRVEPTRVEPARVEPARATATGKTVLGSPSRATAEQNAQQMAPLPGRAPEQPIQIVFDGGSRGNPGEGYGSYQVRWPGNPPQTVRLNFGNHYTNNEAEYDTLIAALDAILKRLADMQADPTSARVEIRGDSLLVINQVLGIWKAKDARMEGRRDRVRTLLRRFGSYSLTHHDRSNSVRDLGH